MQFMILRDPVLVLVNDALFEAMEFTFAHWLPNFKECWVRRGGGGVGGGGQGGARTHASGLGAAGRTMQAERCTQAECSASGTWVL